MSVKRITLKIDNPCHEAWHGMTPTGGGRYCNSCAKQVVDFTPFSDEQLVRFFYEQGGTVCGRLNNHQLNRVLTENNLSTGYSVVARIAAGLLVAAPLAGYAQTPTQGAAPVAPFQKTEQQLAPVEEIKLITADSIQVVIEGNIRFPEDNSPAIGAIAIIEGLSKGAWADINGNFRFTVPDSLLTDSLELKIQFLGYETITMPIRREELIKQRTWHLDVILSMDESMRFVTVGLIISDKEFEKQLKAERRREKRTRRKEDRKEP